MHQANRASSKLQTLKPKPLIYPAMAFAVLAAFAATQLVDSMQQECGTVTDAMVMFILALLWVTQPTHLRHKDIPAMAAIVICTKIVYFADREQSMNFKTDPYFAEWKEWFYSHNVAIIYIPLAACFMLENKINRHHNFGQLHAGMSHGLTGMVAFYNWVMLFHKPDGQAKNSIKTIAATQQEYVEELQMLGYTTYGCTVAALAVSCFVFKLL